MILIATDIGSGNSKARSKTGHFIIPSLSGLVADEGGEDFSLVSHEENKVTFNGKSFWIGNSAKNMLAPAEIMSTLSEHWALSDAYMALMYKAISEALPSDRLKANIGLSTGLPYSFYGKYKEQLKNKLSGTHEFRVGNNDYRITIDRENLFIIAQASALFFSERNDFSKTLTGRHGYIDCGTYTTGFAMFEDRDFNKWESGGENIGASDLIKNVQTYLYKEHGLEVRYESARKAIERGSVALQGHELDLTDQIKRIARETFRSLLEQISSTWKQGKDANIYIGGGMAKVLITLFKEWFPHSVLLSDDEQCVYDVVDGYYVYMSAKMKQRNKAA